MGPGVRQRDPDSLKTLDQLRPIAEAYLARLTGAYASQPDPLPGGPRSIRRQLGPLSRIAAWAIARVRSFGQRIALLGGGIGRRAGSPHYRLGRFLIRIRLIRISVNPWLVALIVASAVGGILLVLLTGQDQTRGAGALISVGAAALFTTALLGLLALFWNDVFRCRYVAWSVRRRIARKPERVLPSTPGVSQISLIPREDPLEMVPRRELCEEFLAGILVRGRRDVQILVGEPGAGKTTALVGLAGALAKVGMVPVLVSLRGKREVNLLEEAQARFEQQFGAHVGSEAELDTLWRWLHKRGRIVVLTDDIDQICPDGERSFVLRHALERFACEGIPLVVSARPSGIPAGIAASAVDLGDLEESQAIEAVVQAAQEDPGSRLDGDAPRRQLERWVSAGRLTEVPFYLELLALLAAVGRSQEPPSGAWSSMPHGTASDGGDQWGALWVRFHLLERFHAEVASGRVRSWLGIGTQERTDALRALEGAALGLLASTAMEACAQGGDAEPPRLRTRLEEFIGGERHCQPGNGRYRQQVSAHEILDTGERLRLLERDHEGNLHFRHRIMQAHLAARCLASDALDPQRSETAIVLLQDRIALLLGPRNPEKLTVQMTLVFAALRSYSTGEAIASNGRSGATDDAGDAGRVSSESRPGPIAEAIIDQLIDHASGLLAVPERSPVPRVSDCTCSAPWTSNHYGDLNPLDRPPRESPTNPDDALIALRTAAEIARAVNWNPAPAEHAGVRPANPIASQDHIVTLVRGAGGAPRWTKLGAIKAVAALDTPSRWSCIWEFTRDDDYAVRQGASIAIKAGAHEAYDALGEDIEELILRAAVLSHNGRQLDVPRTWPEDRSASSDPAAADADGDGLLHWTRSDALKLRALGWVLPAIVSGLRETQDAPGALPDGGAEPDSGDAGGHAACAGQARRALNRLVALAFANETPDLEGSLAEGFKADAMRHACDVDGRVKGPGWVAANRRLVLVECLGRAKYWYARMLFHQALALYAIAGANHRETLQVLGGGRAEDHPFVRTAVLLARRAVEREGLGSDRWQACVWDDENQAAGRRVGLLAGRAAQLVADVTVLLDLKEGSSEASQTQFGTMQELPYCLTVSRDRAEILGAGCASACGWGLCPFEQSPPDEPSSQRGVSRAFCRQQAMLARRRVPSWQPAIGRHRLQDFWREMERRARA